jgi:uncharacterized hydrophobic protein (TIGR00271 family)
MLHLRIAAPAEVAAEVAEILGAEPGVSMVAHLPAVVRKPAGDIVVADVAREAANGVIDRLRALGVPTCGTITVEPVPTYISQSGFDAERIAPGKSADSVVWAEVTQRAYDETELNYTYIAFITLATVMASVAIVLDSQILLIGAMVLGPEFVAVAALGLALVRRRPMLFLRAARTLAVGFAFAILVAAALALAGRAAGWIVEADVTGPRPGTAFIYTPDRWSFLVALVAGAAGVLSLTSSRAGAMVGVFISVTTVPAAGNVALGLAFGIPSAVWGSALQLVVNLAGMALAGWITLVLQQFAWGRWLARITLSASTAGRNPGRSRASRGDGGRDPR